MYNTGLPQVTYETPLEAIKGIGPARAAMLESKGLFTARDLLGYVPRRYEDRTNVKPIARLAPGELATVIAEVQQAKASAFRRRNLGLFEVRLGDGSGVSLFAKWFHGSYLANIFGEGTRVALFGKIDLDNYTGELTMLHPEYEILSADPADGDLALHTGRFVPVYEAAQKVTARMLRVLLHRLIESLPPTEDHLPDSVRAYLKLLPRDQAIRECHFPPSDSDLRLLNAFRSPAQFRLIYEEFFWLECGLALKRAKAKLVAGHAFDLTPAVREQIKKMLPFKPTGAQKRVLGEIAQDLAQPHPMHRLLQGDVGSGKTIVAAQAAVVAIENGFQTAVLAPTEILAAQHYFYFR